MMNTPHKLESKVRFCGLVMGKAEQEMILLLARRLVLAPITTGLGLLITE